MACRRRLFVLLLLTVSFFSDFHWATATDDGHQHDSSHSDSHGITLSTFPANDRCEGAIALEFDQPLVGDTVNYPIHHLQACGYTRESKSKAVWYFVIGTGNVLQASTCSETTDFDTQISVYRLRENDDCNTSLICEDGDDDGCGIDHQKSVVRWQSRLDFTYYIIVHSNDNGEGKFEIVLEDSGGKFSGANAAEVYGDSGNGEFFATRLTTTAENDQCEDAIEVVPGNSYTGSTRFALIDYVTACGPSTSGTAPGVWFYMEGTGDPIEVSLCSPSTTFDTQLSVFSGPSCEYNELTCVVGNDDDPLCSDNDGDGGGIGSSAVTWVSEIGSKYYILVHGFDSLSGGFGLAINRLDSVVNDDCTGAIPLQFNEFIQATTTTATVGSDGNGVDACGTAQASTTSPGVWFSVMGAGNFIQVKTCHNTATFDTQVSVFEGECDNGLTCVNGNDDACGFQSLVGWEAQKDTMYYILVYGFGDIFGDFQITVEEVVAPPNDECVDAVAFPINLSIIGSTVLANYDYTGDAACGSANGASAPGIWYVVEGNGGALQASTCSNVTEYDTQLSIFTGSCASLECVGGNNDYCGDGSFVVWETELETLYYVLVHGYADSSGAFDLTIEKFSEVAPPINDVCDSAISLKVKETQTGSVFLANIDGGVDSCGGASAPSGPGVWFTVKGTGDSLQVTTCGSSTFDTQISVFRGSSCDTLICVDGDDDTCGIQSLVSWESEQDLMYYILVHGFENSTGTYEVVVEESSLATTPLIFDETTKPPTEKTDSGTITPLETESREIDRCTQALPSGSASIFSGSTVSSTIDNSVGNCGEATRSTTPGAWFSVTGSGRTLLAGTCGSSFDTQISVFEGGCDDLICVTGSDDQCGFQSIVTWTAEQGVVYYVYVHGYENAVGEYILSFEEISPIANDECSGAAPLPLGLRISSSTVSATIDNLNSCGDATATTSPGVWFSFVGNGHMLQVSTCAFDQPGYTDLDTQISVFAGGISGSGSSCDELICVTGNDQFCGDLSSASWESENRTMYYILVHGYEGLIGNFDIRAQDLEQPLNENCDNAVLIPANANEVLGSTSMAKTNNVAFCGDSTAGTAPGVWFKIEGTGKRIQASTCGLYTSFDTQISVFVSEDGNNSCGSDDNNYDSLLCVTGNNDWCNEQSYVSWVSEIGSMYFILVHGSGGSSGDFGLVFEEIEILNEECSFAANLPLGTLVEGTTATSKADMVFACGDATGGLSPGAWFSVTGTGNALRASTCSFSTFDTQISVFVGSCTGGLTCVNGNDDGCNLQSLVIWPSDANVVYYVFVYGFIDSYTEVGDIGAGDFEIIVDEVIPPRNDKCEEATAIGMDGSIEVGRTTLSTSSLTLVDKCGDATESTNAGVWFVVVGTGDIIQASTCGPITLFDTQISVFTGSCNELVCVTGNDQYCGDQSLVRWNSESDLLYYVLVHGHGGETGDFGIVISIPSTIPPPNDYCTSSLPLVVGESTIGTTLIASIDWGLGAGCGKATEIGTPGVWYSVMGTGNQLRASTCADTDSALGTTDFDTQISVFRGECGSALFECVDGNDDDCGIHSTVSWESEVDTVYYILVYGFGVSAGRFVLATTTYQIPALTATEDGVVVDGSGDEMVDGGEVVITGGHSVIGDGEIVVEGEAEVVEGMEVEVETFGSYIQSTEITTTSSPTTGSSVNNLSVPTNYDSTGNVPKNNVCEDAIFLSLNMANQIGYSTFFATYDVGVSDCGTTVVGTAPGVWFVTEGTGDVVIASTCGLATFDTQISIYSGPTCNDLICVDGNDDWCNIQSTISWKSEIDRSYYILVHGFADSVGDFGIIVQKIADVVDTASIPLPGF